MHSSVQSRVRSRKKSDRPAFFAKRKRVGQLRLSCLAWTLKDIHWQPVKANTHARGHRQGALLLVWLVSRCDGVQLVAIASSV